MAVCLMPCVHELINGGGAVVGPGVRIFVWGQLDDANVRQDDLERSSAVGAE